jgi:hypothetical protein
MHVRACARSLSERANVLRRCVTCIFRAAELRGDAGDFLAAHFGTVMGAMLSEDFEEMRVPVRGGGGGCCRMCARACGLLLCVCALRLCLWLVRVRACARNCVYARVFLCVRCRLCGE